MTAVPARSSVALFLRCVVVYLAWLILPVAASGAVGRPAYIGPGPGLGLIGAFLAVLAAIVIGLMGLILYPLRLFRQWRRRHAAKAASEAGHD